MAITDSPIGIYVSSYTFPDNRPRRTGVLWSFLLIYYYHNAQKPILLLLIYAKARQENLTSGQKSRLKKYVDQIIEKFG